MSDIAIKVEGISKRYDLLHQKKAGADSLAGAFAGGVKNLFRSQRATFSQEDFWALKDIDFSVKKGDRLGVIGRNGAGKSTLLKILSRIVKPTSGKIEYEGRLAGLLEVGTGFHADLSGRENIYLNGSILGMSKREIDAKFDEIVAFSEVEQFLDTPVKRYSSGMYVRLAFAVAAHLDNDILIVDEVLAVGDAAFQEKCIGKISTAQSEGKTVLFVSHNIGQIAALCNKGLYLEKGQVKYDGDIHTAIDFYLNKNKDEQRSEVSFEDKKSEFQINKISLYNHAGRLDTKFKHNETYQIRVTVTARKAINDLVLSVLLNDNTGKRIVSLNLPLTGKIGANETKELVAEIAAEYLMPNEYFVSVALHIPNIQLFDEQINVLSYKIIDNGSEFYKYSGDLGYVFPKNQWRY